MLNPDSKILVVEDTETIRKLLIIRLAAHYGMPRGNIGEAENGDDGLRQLTSEKYDLVMTDQKMPDEGDGVAFIKAIRADKNLRDITVILMSGNDIPEEEVLENGGDAFCCKMDLHLPTYLYDTVARAFKHRAEQIAARNNPAPLPGTPEPGPA